MKKKLTRNTKRRILTLLSMLVLMNISSFLTTNYLNPSDTTKTLEEQFDFKSLELSNGVGEDPWWNENFQWRHCINITNPYDDNLVDGALYIRINHTKYIDQGNMQDDLDDIRIVENGVLRDYYFTTDWPFGDMATIWFEVNISAQTTDYDTYLYFGNASISFDSDHYKEDRFGLAWYSFDDDTVAGTVKDSMGKNNATLNGLGVSVAYVSGHSGNALDFDDSQTTAYIDAPNTIINGLTDFTICFWATEGISGEYLISGSSGSNHNYMLMRSTTLTGWHFYIWRRNSTGIHIYTDLSETDNLVYTNPGSPITIDSGGFIIAQEQDSLGGGFSSSQAFHGEIDDMRFFNYGLSDREMRWLFNDYSLDIELLPEQERASTVTVIVKDVDGLRIPGAEVSLWNGTTILNITGIGVFTQTTGPTGSVVFSGVPFGKYNITANYTLNSGLYEKVVYDSRTEVDGELDFSGLFCVTTIYTDMWTIDFEVDDWDGDPLNYGFINISETSSSEVLETLELDLNGLSTFRWLNRSSYYCEVYYNNSDYFQQYTLLNTTTIYRQSAKTTYLVNNTNVVNPGVSAYSVAENTFLPGSDLGNPGSIKVIDASANFINMNDKMNQTSIWFMDSIGYRSKEAKIYTGSVTEDTFIYHPNEEETYDVYGLRFEVEGDNSTQCNGIIEVTLTYAYSQYIKTNMSKLNIRIIDDKYYEPVEGITVKIAQNCTNGGTYIPGDTVIDLKTDDNGTAYGDTNDELVFLYKTGWTYNLSLWIVSTRYDLYVNTSDQYYNPDTLLSYYNYTLNAASSLILEIDLNYDERQSRLTNSTSGGEITQEFTWGQNMTFSINFSITDDGGINWYGDNASDVSLTCTVEDMQNQVLFVGSMNHLPSTLDGNYTITINSSIFSAGDDSQFYLIEITGEKTAYKPPPSDDSFPIQINTLPTGMKAYNYSSLNELTINEVSQYYGELINITVKYYDNITEIPLTADIFTYEWDYGSGSVGIDSINPGYYTYELDTTDASIVGKYRIDFTASLENHTKIENFGVYINILSRPTELNGSTDVLFVSESIYALEAQNFTFNYVDILSSNPVSNPDEMSYNWQKLDELGDPIPGETGSGSLVETPIHSYILDLNTEVITLGDYFVYVSLGKSNYEEKIAILSLTIMDRPTTLNGSISFIPSAIDINLGEFINITFSYVDTLTSLDITSLDNQSYTYTSNVPSDLSGMGTLVFDTNTNLYVLDFGTASRLNGTYTIIVTLDKENYTKQPCSITLIISKVQDNYQSYLTLTSQNPLNLLTEVFWRDEISITFNFSTTEDGGSSIYLNNSDSINLQFRDESLNPIGASIDLINYNTSKGIYTFVFNTSEFLFIGGNTYQLEIRAGKSGYNPADMIIAFKVLAVTTDLTVHDYTTGTEFPSYTISEYWNTTLGITLYYTESVPGSPITDAGITFSWFYGSGQVLPDATKGAGYYSFFFNTGNASEVGAYTITFLATKQNYSDGVPVSNFIINVINRPTMLDTSANVLYISQNIYVQEAYNFTFEYIDFLTSNLIESVDEMSFVLQKLDGDGDPIPGESIIGTLFERLTHRYVLDLNTETLAYGEYSIVVTLNKDNYDFRVAIVSLTINKRVFAEVLSISTLTEIESGGALEFQVTLTDPNNNSNPIIGGTLYFTIQGTRHDLDDNLDGTYSLTIDFLADPFFMPETIKGKLTIEKANFTTSETSITVVVKMTEIFGFPMFWFLMIVGAIIAVAGSLVAYRLIQQARIPTFVKKVREMSKNIKGRKSISDSLLYPSKDELIVKKLGDRWDLLGLSLDEILGLDAKSKKKLPETTNFKGGKV